MRQSVIVLTALFAGIALGVFAGEVRRPGQGPATWTTQQQQPSTASSSSLTPDSEPRDSIDMTAAVSPVESATLSTLMQELERAERERQALLSQHEALQNKLERLEKRLALTTLDSEFSPAPLDAAESEAGQVSAPSLEESENGKLEALLAAGFDAYQAAEIKRRAGEAEMDRLYLRDRAIREGWFRTDRYREELETLEDPEDYLRTQMGDEAFDRYLYAGGESNRLRIQSVIEASPAAAAGIESGDLIYRYANQRIFSSEDLRAAMADGNAGESVAVEISRDGSHRSYYVSRGPLGVRLAPARVEP